MSLDRVYQEVIIEYSKDMSHRKQLPEATHHEHGHNPNCGDDIELELEISDGMIKDMGFIGDGCAISMASTSMMIDLVNGKSLTEAKKIVEEFLEMIKGEKSEEELYESHGDATLLSNIKYMPARVKCAVLAWHTLDELIKKDTV